MLLIIYIWFIHEGILLDPLVSSNLYKVICHKVRHGQCCKIYSKEYFINIVKKKVT